MSQRLTYIGTPYDKSYHMNVELVENMLSKMKRGQAAGLDGLTVEHLTHSHPILLLIIVKLFNLCLLAGYVPHTFGLIYTVPILNDQYRLRAENQM